MSLQLRRAEDADRDLLFIWANDDVVRANAFHTEKILYESHVKWFENMMADPDTYQYIFCKDKEPVGQLRLNIEGSEALVDYSVARDQRGKGYGSEMLRRAYAQLTSDKISGVTKIVGQVKYGNHASARAFETCHFLRRELPEYIQYEKELK